MAKNKHSRREEEERINVSVAERGQQRDNRGNAPSSAENFHTMEFTRPPVPVGGGGGNTTELDEFRTIVLPPPTRLPSDTGAVAAGIDSYHTIAMPPPTRIPTSATDNSGDIDSFKTKYFGPPIRLSSQGSPAASRPGLSQARSVNPRPPPAIQQSQQQQQLPNAVAYRHTPPHERQSSEISGSNQSRGVTLMSTTKVLVAKVLLYSSSALVLLVAIAFLLVVKSSTDKFYFSLFRSIRYLLVAAIVGALHGLLQTLLVISRIAIGKPLFNNYSRLAQLLAYICDQVATIMLVTAATATYTFPINNCSDPKNECESSKPIISTMLVFVASLLMLINSTISSYMLFSNNI